MDKQRYVKVMGYFEEHKRLCKTLNVIEKAFEILTIIIYFAMIIYCLYDNTAFALRSAVTSLIALFICTLIRQIKDSKRPYEVFEILPAMNKDAKGQSFPSRHITSVSVISISLLYVWLPIGIAFIIITAIMGTLRVLLGVHFVKDVIFGALIGFVIGIIGVYLFPLMFK